MQAASIRQLAAADEAGEVIAAVTTLPGSLRQRQPLITKRPQHFV